MILHYAHLCAAAGGVEAFLLGSELKALTTARDGAGSFPAVAAMKALAADVRSILPSAKISYGADWSEWSGVTKADGRFFHLDPLWADNNVDFVGIDYYPPLADWRDGFAHADFAAGWRSQYDRAYIAANIEGGENFDWHYASEADRAAQVRTPIADAAYGEPWIFRAKDLRSWWRNAHHDRPGFVRAGTPTQWVPKSKPIRFAEFGVPAVDKGANAPNVFVDPKSSESALPPFSSGARDDLAQRRAIEAVLGFWRANNEAEAGVPLIETDRLYVYAFDARPYPFFPARADLWGDAANWEKGHWLNGRLSRAPLDKLVAALAREAGVAVDAALLKGSLAGYVVDRPLSPRQTIDPLADVFQFDMVETETGLRFQPRGGGRRPDARHERTRRSGRWRRGARGVRPDDGAEGGPPFGRPLGVHRRRRGLSFRRRRGAPSLYGGYPRDRDRDRRGDGRGERGRKSALDPRRRGGDAGDGDVRAAALAPAARARRCGQDLACGRRARGPHPFDRRRRGAESRGGARFARRL
jgi:hypothetical protein